MLICCIMKVALFMKYDIKANAVQGGFSGLASNTS